MELPQCPISILLYLNGFLTLEAMSSETNVANGIVTPENQSPYNSEVYFVKLDNNNDTISNNDTPETLDVLNEMAKSYETKEFIDAMSKEDLFSRNGKSISDDKDSISKDYMEHVDEQDLSTLIDASFRTLHTQNGKRKRPLTSIFDNGNNLLKLKDKYVKKHQKYYGLRHPHTTTGGQNLEEILINAQRPSKNDKVTPNIMLEMYLQKMLHKPNPNSFVDTYSSHSRHIPQHYANDLVPSLLNSWVSHNYLPTIPLLNSHPSFGAHPPNTHVMATLVDKIMSKVIYRPAYYSLFG